MLYLCCTVFITVLVNPLFIGYLIAIYDNTLLAAVSHFPVVFPFFQYFQVKLSDFYAFQVFFAKNIYIILIKWYYLASYWLISTKFLLFFSQFFNFFDIFKFVKVRFIYSSQISIIQCVIHFFLFKILIFSLSKSLVVVSYEILLVKSLFFTLIFSVSFFILLQASNLRQVLY